MRDQAIALRRISSSGQADGHSLGAQQLSTERMAKEKDLDLVKSWDEIKSSKKGKNFGRRDLEEMLRYCKQNRKVKYLLIDFVNRLMREVEVMIYYKVLFNQLGVELYFCDPSQHHLNGKDQYSQLMLLIEGYKSEQDNLARYETTMARMKARYSEGYYLSKPHAGYMKSDIPGIHVPDPTRYDVLQKGSRLIIYNQYTPEQAVKWINQEGYRTTGGRKLTVDHYIEFITDRYYCGKIDISTEGWPKNIEGKHQRMFSILEHKLLTNKLKKRNPRKVLIHNPEFPLANLLRHEECRDHGHYEKFSGHFYNPGKTRNGTQLARRPVYDCRDCRKRIDREEVTNSFAKFLNNLKFQPTEEAFRRALIKVWRNQRGTVIQRLSGLKDKRNNLEQLIRETAINYSKEPEGATKNALKLVLEDYDSKLKRLEDDISRTNDQDLVSESFVKFAFDFTRKLRDKWWKLSFDNMKMGEHILFNEKIYMDNATTVHPADLSSIYRLGTNKKDLGKVNFDDLVELPVIATGSASLSWLVIYRLSLFYEIRRRLSKQTNIPSL